MTNIICDNATTPIDDRRMWVVMKAYDWSAVTLYGKPLHAPVEGPQRFIPVFATREQEVQFAGSDDNVTEVMLQSP